MTTSNTSISLFEAFDFFESVWECCSSFELTHNRYDIFLTNILVHSNRNK